MITVVIATLRRAAHFFVASIVAVAAGIGLLAFTSVGGQSAVASVEQRVNLKGIGYEFTIARTNPNAVITEEVLRTLQKSEGIADVDPQYSVLGTGGPESADISVYSVPLEPGRPKLSNGMWPTPGTVAISLRAASQWDVTIGDKMVLADAFSPSPGEYEIVGIVDPTGHSAAGDTDPVAFLTREDLTDLFPNLRPVSVGIVTSSSFDASGSLTSALPDGLELRNRQDMVASALEQRRAAGSLVSVVLRALSLASLLSAWTVIATSLTYSVVARRRQHALLRTIGVNRRQIFWSVVSEALFVGCVGSLVGITVGVLAVWLCVNVSWIPDPFNADLVAVGLGNLLETASFGVLVALLSVLAPAWRARKATKGASVGEVIGKTPTTLGGYARRIPLWLSALIGVGIVLGVYSNSFGDVMSFLVLPIGLLFLLPVLRPVLEDSLRGLGVFIRAAKLDNVPTVYAALQNMVSSARNSAGTITGLTISIATIMAILTASSTFTSHAVEDARSKFPFTLVGSSSEPLSEADVNSLKRTEGVQDVQALGSGKVSFSSSYSRTIASVTPDQAKELYPQVDSTYFTDDRLYVSPSEYLPKSADADSDYITLTGPNGNVTLRVVKDPLIPDSLGFLITRANAQILGVTEPTVVVVRGSDDSLSSADLNQYEAWQRLIVRPAFLEAESFLAALNTAVTAARAVFVVGFFVAMVGITNALFIAIAQRTRTIALTRALGLSARGCRRALFVEATTMAVVALAIAIPLGMAVGVGLARAFVGMEFVPGLDPEAFLPVVIDRPATLLLVGGSVACSVAACILPALRVMRVSPGQGLTG